MYNVNIINQVLPSIAFEKENLRFTRIVTPIIIRRIMKFRSKGLPYSPSPAECENQIANGLLAIRSTHIVGIQTAKEHSWDIL
jgi:hypothetical protein